MKIFLIFLTITVIFAEKSHAETLDNAVIENFAKEYLHTLLSNSDNNPNLAPSKKSKLTIKVAKIDPRVKFNVCQNNLTADIPEKFNGRNVNIKISCDDLTPWHTYLVAKVKKIVPIVVAMKVISKGELLNSSNIEVAYIDSYKIRGAIIDNPKLVIGSKAKKRISKAHAVTRKNTCMVCKGDHVSIIAKSATFTIKTNGKALSSGNAGDQVKVKNKRSGKTITAQVNAINKVLINL